MESKLNLRLLSVAVTLYEERSVTAAAKKLRLSQPVLSKDLMKLRRIFGDALFVKTGYGMIPTPRAHNLIDPARQALLSLRRDVLRDPEFDPATSRATFTFAAGELGDMFLFPKIAAALPTLAPRTSCRTVCPADDELIRELESGEIDIALGMFPAVEKNEFFQQRLTTLTTVCVTRADRAIPNNTLSRRRYEQLGHVAVTGQRGAAYSLDRLIGKEKLKRRIVCSVTHFTGLPMIIRRCDAVATVCSPMAKYLCLKNPDLKMVKPPFQITQTLAQHWHARYQNDRKNRWLRQVVKSIFVTEDSVLETG